jgi:hypothetical protein
MKYNGPGTPARCASCRASIKRRCGPDTAHPSGLGSCRFPGTTSSPTHNSPRACAPVRGRHAGRSLPEHARRFALTTVRRPCRGGTALAVIRLVTVPESIPSWTRFHWMDTGVPAAPEPARSAPQRPARRRRTLARGTERQRPRDRSVSRRGPPVRPCSPKAQALRTRRRRLHA